MIDGKTLSFKTLVISKVVHLALVKDIPSSTIAQLEKIQKQFIWKNGNPKLKHTTLCNRYEQGGLKNVDIFFKITSLQCFCVKRLSDDSFHAWKKIPLFLIKSYLGRNVVFHSNLSIKQNDVKISNTTIYILYQSAPFGPLSEHRYQLFHIGFIWLLSRKN